MKQDQHQMFHAETTWFHVFRDMLESGDVAKMGPHAVTVYLCIKGYTNWKTGKAWPGIDLIVEKTGVSERMVNKCLNTLVEFGYLNREKHGRNNVYTLREKVDVYDSEGRPAATATWDYLPSSVSDAGAELKNFLLTGKHENATIIHIEHLTLNLQQNFSSNNEMHNYNLDNIKDPRIREQAKRIEELRRKKSK